MEAMPHPAELESIWEAEINWRFLVQGRYMLMEVPQEEAATAVPAEMLPAAALHMDIREPVVKAEPEAAVPEPESVLPADGAAAAEALPISIAREDMIRTAGPAA